MLIHRKALMVAILVAILVPLGVLQAAPMRRLPTAGEVVINEFVAAPSSGSEWVELYNTTTTTLDLGGLYLDDIAGGGASPKVIPGGTTIAAHSYYVLNVTGLNNTGGDDVR